jgi:hypothetical protein
MTLNSEFGIQNSEFVCVLLCRKVRGGRGGNSDFRIQNSEFFAKEAKK